MRIALGVAAEGFKIFAMSAGKASWATVCIGLAKMILHTRAMRRKMLFQLVIFLVVLVALGAWPLSGWLGGNIWLFLVWWGFAMLYGTMVILLAIYDMLAVVKEEREKIE
ncbi:MAG: hypothetical protein ACPG32_10470 [Akkermansiaceae bacterium]